MEGGNKNPFKKGLWTEEEDRVLLGYIATHGKGHWNRVAKASSLKRSGKSCRLRWLNYLSPAVNRGCFSKEEDDLIIRLHKLLGNRWSLIAGRVPGRTDNQVKNHWNTHLRKQVRVAKGVITKSSSTSNPKPLLQVESDSNKRLSPENVSGAEAQLEATTTTEDMISKAAYDQEDEAQWMINMLTSDFCSISGLGTEGIFLDSYLLDPL